MPEYMCRTKKRVIFFVEMDISTKYDCRIINKRVYYDYCLHISGV